MLAEGHPADLVEAVLAVGSGDLGGMAERVRALSGLVRDGRFGPIRVTFRRVAGLIREHHDDAYRLDLFEGEAEYQLHLAASRLPDAGAPVPELLAALAELRPLVDRFFDAVLVMTEDLPLQKNRLGLLRSVLNRFGTLADFTRLSSEATAA
jgi:glycyl-tRNA synthetase beta chain